MKNEKHEYYKLKEKRILRSSFKNQNDFLLSLFTSLQVATCEVEEDNQTEESVEVPNKKKRIEITLEVNIY